jgi:hypothetical protein
VLLVNSGTPLSRGDARRAQVSARAPVRSAGRRAAARIVAAAPVRAHPALRPYRSARKYARIWTAAGSPMITLSAALRPSSPQFSRSASLRPSPWSSACSTASLRLRRACAVTQFGRAEDPHRAALSPILRGKHGGGVRPGHRRAAPLALASGAALHRRIPRSSRLHRSAARQCRAALANPWAHRTAARVVSRDSGALLPARRSVFLQVSEDRAPARRGAHAAR